MDKNSLPKAEKAEVLTRLGELSRIETFYVDLLGALLGLPAAFSVALRLKVYAISKVLASRAEAVATQVSLTNFHITDSKSGYNDSPIPSKTILVLEDLIRRTQASSDVVRQIRNVKVASAISIVCNLIATSEIELKALYNTVTSIDTVSAHLHGEMSRLHESTLRVTANVSLYKDILLTICFGDEMLLENLPFEYRISAEGFIATRVSQLQHSLSGLSSRSGNLGSAKLKILKDMACTFLGLQLNQLDLMKNQELEHKFAQNLVSINPLKFSSMSVSAAGMEVARTIAQQAVDKPYYFPAQVWKIICGSSIRCRKEF